MSDSLLPPNASASEQALALSLARLSEVPVPLRPLWDVETCPAALLPWLAWTLSLDEWDSAWSEAQKRQAIRRSVYVHQHKGTRAAVEASLQAVGWQCTLTEWWEPAGRAAAMAPYTFTVNVDVSSGIDQATLDKIRRLVTAAKNVRSSFELNASGRQGGVAYVGAGCLAAETVTIQAGV